MGWQLVHSEAGEVDQPEEGEHDSVEVVLGR